MTDDRQLWQEASERAWFCANCGQQHVGIFDLGFDAPAYWDRARTSGSGGLARVGENLLSDDFCVVGGEHYFVRTVLEISIVGVKEAKFGYGIWSSLSKANFELYRDTFDDGDQDRLGPWFGWFANELPGYPSTLSL